MTYYFSDKIVAGFDEAIERTKGALKNEGFGIITEIDVKNTFKEKLAVDFKNYRILGACNPNFAYRALQAEDKAGIMLPCNVIVQETEAGSVEVAAVDPVASMAAIDNPELLKIAETVREKLESAIKNL